MSPRLAVTPLPSVPVPVTADQAIRARALAKFQRQEAEREERARKEEDERRAEAEAADRLKKELRGQKVTLDETGQVLVVKRVPYARLPPTFESVGVAIDGMDDEKEAEVRMTRARVAFSFWVGV